MKKHKAKTRADMLLKKYKDFLPLMFGNDENAIAEFGQWLLKQDRIDDDLVFDGLIEDDNKLINLRIAEERGKKYKSINECIVGIECQHYVVQDIEKQKLLETKLKHTDLGLATYTNSKRYRRACLNTDDYRAYLKKLAKREQKEFKEMRAQGFIKSKDPDEELAKIMKANNYMSEALSESYIQKYFIK